MTAIIVLQPDREVPAGILGTQLAERGAAVAVHELWHGPALPEAASTCAGLVVLGGTASALGAEQAAVVAVLRSRLAAGRPTLELGLGAQLLTLALGGAIRPAAAPEFGYVDLVPTALAAGDPVLRGIGAEIVRHQERAERFGRSVADGWLDLVASTA